jgi:TPR repeat protein
MTTEHTRFEFIPAANAFFTATGCIFAITLTIGLCSASASQQPPSPSAKCDEEAGFGAPKGTATFTVPIEKIRPEIAIPACLEALESSTDSRLVYQLGRAYEKAGDYKKAIERYQSAADAWYLPAFNAFGNMYISGKGVKIDYGKAFAWYQKAAEHGLVSAQLNLADLYRNGDGVAKSDEMALKWFLKAAEQGDAEAQTSVGFLIQRLGGIQADEAAAFGWFWQAAQQGNPVAQKEVGEMLRIGIGVKKNPSLAFVWLEKSALLGNDEAQHNLGIMYELGEGVGQDTDQAIFWLTKAANQGNKGADSRLKALTEGIAEMNAYIQKSGKSYRAVRATSLIEMPGAVICDDYDLAATMFELYSDYVMKSFDETIQKDTEQSRLLHGAKPPPARKPNFKTYGCVFAATGTPMYLEIDRIDFPPVVIVLNESDGIYHVHRGVTLINNYR